jgi:hypothetical protein
MAAQELMVGIKPVCDAFGISEEQFYMFLGLGLPMRKINGRWYGHRENISIFFKKITMGPPVSIDPARARELSGNDTV